MHGVSLCVALPLQVVFKQLLILKCISSVDLLLDRPHFTHHYV
jgi:hypothetical protein